MFLLMLFEALSSIRANKSRTILTLLGVVIGIASVVTVIAAGDGGKAIIMQEFEGLSPGTLQIAPNYEIYFRNRQFRIETVKDADLKDLKKKIQEIDYLAPIDNFRAVVTGGDANNAKNMNILATSSDYFSLMDLKIGRGRFFTPLEDRTLAKVAVIGSLAAEELFRGDDPLGRYIISQGIPVKVVGVLKKKEKSNTISISNPDNTINRLILIPSSMLQRFGGENSGYPYVLASVSDLSKIHLVRTRMLSILNRNHGKWDNKYAKFMVVILDEQLKMIDTVISLLTSGVAILAGIALLVAAIGIMNIMLMTVKERTREIGIRKALGAKRKQILFQFLLETLILCGSGGLLGLLIAAAAATGIGYFAHWPAVIKVHTALLALGLAMLTGIISGVVPASRAARLPPQEALRYE